MGQKLLLADDSVTIQRVIELTFADENINVIAVSDGDQAIARIDADPPDIVLADIGMPGKDGYEVAAHVKSNPRFAHIPVVLLTGAFEPVDQQRAVQVGSDGVLAKPFEPQLVIARVKELLDRRPAASAGAATAHAATAAPSRPASLDAPFAASTAAADTERGPQLDDYFDRLDAAFANLSAQPSAPAPAPSQASAPVPDIDWFNAAKPASTSSPDLPLSYASPEPPVATPPAPAVAQAPAPATFASPAPPAPLPTVSASAVPSLADAFAAILAAEEANPAAAAVQWPSAPAEVNDTMVEEITRRVLERMSDRVVHETVGAIVSEVAERLIRDEIERIKASIK